jgi:hypothetical protein
VPAVLLLLGNPLRADRRLEVADGDVGSAQRSRDAGPRVGAAVRGDRRPDLLTERHVADGVEDDRSHEQHPDGSGAVGSDDAQPVAAGLGCAEAQ